MRVDELLAHIDQRFPLSAAATWDHVGLQIGDGAAQTRTVAVCHELTPEAVDEVVHQDIGTVVAYHPLIFTPTTSVTSGPSATGRAFTLLSAGVAVIVVHTAFDVAPGGAADALAAALGLTSPRAFGGEDDELPIGRIGSVTPMSLEAFAAMTAEELDTVVRHTGGTNDVGTVAVVPGSGSSLIDRVAGIADVLVTGDVKHHDAVRATELGLAVVDAGHIATERPGIEALYAAVAALDADAVRIDADPNPWRE